MVRALLAGNKTQTRRIIKKGQPTNQWEAPDPRIIYPCKYGKEGDLLYVRETCRAKELSDKEAEKYCDGDKYEIPPYGLDGVFYEADKAFIEIENTIEASDAWGEMSIYRGNHGAKVNSIHMPRWASRITLKVTHVRVERVQDISGPDAVEEGICGADICYGISKDEANILQYKSLWNSINNNWDENPWVWVVCFEVIQINVDEYIRNQGE